MNFKDWAFYKRGILSISPPYRDITVDKKALFNHYKGAFYIRWTSDYDKTENHNYYYVVKDSDFNIDNYKSRVRNKIRRCLNNSVIQLCDYKNIVNNSGYEIFLSEHRRYAKKGFPSTPKQETQWIDGMKEAAENGHEFWSVVHEGKLIAYAVSYPNAEHVDLVTWKVDYEHFNHLYPSYGLLYTICKYYSDKGCKFANDGSRSLTEHSSVQDFLIDNLGFRKAYAKLNVIFKWYLMPPLFFLTPFEKYIKNNKLRSLVRLYKWSR
ncbi:MAG: hypothetical protein K6A41_05790 [Bacteroidales bacterium]|nr:hypothetical protein [Bacteroidales bacterium]